MLAHLQKQINQVSSKFLSVPVKQQPKPSPAAQAFAKKTAQNFQKSSVVPKAPTSSNNNNLKTKAVTDSDVAATEDGSVATAMANKNQQSLSDIKIDKTKSKAARIRSIQHAMSKERNVREAQEPFDFMTNVKRFNWKALIAFMICWTILGYYIVPWIKGWKGFKPPTQEEKDAEYNKGKQKLVEDTYRLRQRIEARKMRAERLDELGSATTNSGGAESSK